MILGGKPLGDRLNEIAEKKNMSATKACEMAGLSGSFIRDLKRGVKKSVSVEKLHALAQVFGVSVTHIIDESGDDVNIAGQSLIPVPIADGRIVHVIDRDEPVAVSDETLVAAKIGGEPMKLYEISSIGNMDVLYPIDIDGIRGAAVSYAQEDDWHTGTALLDGQPCKYHIQGVVRWISTPCK